MTGTMVSNKQRQNILEEKAQILAAFDGKKMVVVADEAGISQFMLATIFIDREQPMLLGPQRKPAKHHHQTSIGWLSRFSNRYSISVKATGGETAGGSHEKVNQCRSGEIKKILSSLREEDILFLR